MQNKLLRRSSTSVIILLLILLSIIPSISGNTEKMSIKSKDEIPAISQMSNSYVNAYWKFNTGSGNTAYDSSGHDYDGIIYGASWTTDTPSGSGYALDFDGVTDYIDLDTYSSNLAFNKTDDLIFSFNIKTQSNQKGMIFSTSTGWGTNPEFHIFLAENGTIGVKAEVTSCGFTLYTNDSYNNNVWHYIEVWFNGITNMPTVTVFVDNDPVASITHWVCPFESGEFKRTKIGRRSHNSTNFFDGKIDDLKIIKYPGGNEQEPPIIEGPTSGDIGVEYDYDFTTYDPEDDEIWLWIKWGDGDEELWEGPYDSGETATFSHAWDEEGDYYITAQSKDVWHHSSWSDEYKMLIGNQPPDIPTINGEKRYGSIGEELTFTVVSEDFEGSAIRYFLDWDDGDTDWTNFYPSGQVVTVKHTWDANDDYEITSYAEDTQGKKSTESEPYLIRIGDQPPNKPTINGPQHGIPEKEYTFTFKSIDPEGDKVSFDIDWGDGSSVTDYGPFDSGEEIELSHTWTSRDTYTISARAIDFFGNPGEWEEFYIIIPKSKAINLNILEWLFVRFSNTFPIFKFLFNS